MDAYMSGVYVIVHSMLEKRYLIVIRVNVPIAKFNIPEEELGKRTILFLWSRAEGNVAWKVSKPYVWNVTKRKPRKKKIAGVP
jgi:hypothetical protein